MAVPNPLRPFARSYLSLVALSAALAACQSDQEPPAPSIDASGGAATAGAGGEAAGGGSAEEPSGEAGAGGSASAGASGQSGAAGTGTGAGAGSGGEAGGGGQNEGGWGSSACVATPDETGFAVGDVIGSLPLRACFTGEPASLDEVCGASATWIFAAHTHCPTCKATAGYTDDVAKAVADRNVAIVHTVYDDNGTSCEQWAAAYGFASYPNVRVYEDPGGAVWQKLKLSNYTAPSAFLDGDRRITHKEHGMSKSAVLAKIDAIVDP